MEVLALYKKERNLSIANRTSMVMTILVLIFLTSYLTKNRYRTKYTLLLGIPIFLLAIATLIITAIAETQNDLLETVPKVSKLQVPADYLSVIFVSLILFTSLIYIVFADIRRQMVECIIKGGNQVVSPKIFVEISGICIMWVVGILYYSTRFAGI